MNSSPMDTMAANALGRGDGDTAYRDMIGDSGGDAMHTHVGMRQGTASNVQSGYNNASMSDVQKSIMMVDATRGYGSDSGHENTGGSMYDTGPANSSMTPQTSTASSMYSSHESGFSSMNNDSAFSLGHDTSSAHSINHNMTPSSSNHPSMGGVNTGGTPQSFNPTMDAPSTLESSLFSAAALGAKQAVAPSSIMDKKIKPTVIYIEKAPDQYAPNSSNSEQDSRVDIIATGTKKGTGSTIDEEEELEEEIKVLPRGKKSSSNIVMRPIVPPRSMNAFSEQAVKTPKKVAVKEKLQKLSYDDFFKLLDKVSAEVEEGEGKSKTVAICKMNLLKEEATRRHESAEMH